MSEDEGAHLVLIIGGVGVGNDLPKLARNAGDITIERIMLTHDWSAKKRHP